MEEKQKEHWVFFAYKKDKHFPLKPMKVKVFEDFDKMKEYSAKHSSKYKTKEYCSTYIKSEL